MLISDVDRATESRVKRDCILMLSRLFDDSHRRILALISSGGASVGVDANLTANFELILEEQRCRTIRECIGRLEANT